MTLEDLLVGSRTIDFRVRAEPMEGYVACYIHPLDEDGETIDFTVVGNQVTVAVRAPIEGDILEHPKLETFEFETATIEPDASLLVQTSDDEDGPSDAEQELSGWLEEGRAIGCRK